MSQKRGAVAAAQVEIFAAIKVPQPAPGGAVEVERVSQSPVEARGGRHAAGEELSGKLVLFGDAGHGGGNLKSERREKVRRASLRQHHPAVDEAAQGETQNAAIGCELKHGPLTCTTTAANEKGGCVGSCLQDGRGVEQVVIEGRLFQTQRPGAISNGGEDSGSRFVGAEESLQRRRSPDWPLRHGGWWGRPTGAEQ